VTTEVQAMKQGYWKKIQAVAGILLFILAFTAGFAQAQGPPAKGNKQLSCAFEGAPPLIPHDVEARKGLCQSCHGTGEGGAPITPHPNRTHFCLQCHIGQDLSVKPFVQSPSKKP
jgi:nitrate reductase cytochrome c-type subunit